MDGRPAARADIDASHESCRWQLDRDDEVAKDVGAVVGKLERIGQVEDEIGLTKRPISRPDWLRRQVFIPPARRTVCNPTLELFDFLGSHAPLAREISMTGL